MPQDTGDEELEAARAADAQARADKASQMSVGGFAENTLDDAFGAVKGIAEQVLKSPYYAGKALYDMDYGALLQHPEAIWQGINDAGTNIVNGVTQDFREKGFGRALYEKPISNGLLNLTALTGFAGGAVAKFGELAEAARGGELASLAERVAANPVVRAGRALENLPSRLVRGGVDAAAGSVGIDLPAKRLERALTREERGMAAQKYLKDVTSPASTLGLSEEEKGLFQQFRKTGANPDDLAKRPALKAAWEGYNKYVDEREALLRNRVGYTQEDLDNVTAKKYAKEVLGDTRDEAVAAAKEKIAQMPEGMRPRYGSDLFEHPEMTQSQALDNLLGIGKKFGKGSGKLSFLEKYSGAGGAIEDPNVYVPRSMKAFREFEGNLNYIDRLVSEPTLATRAATLGEEGLSNLVPKGSTFEKYIGKDAKSKAMFVKQMVNEFGEGATAKLLSPDEATLSKLNEVTGIVLNPSIRRVVQMKFSGRATGPLGGFLHYYDGLLNLVKKSATIGNPKWYSGVAIGNAIQSLLAGNTFGNMARARRFFDIMPAELKGSMFHAPAQSLLGKVGGFFQRAADFVHGMSDAVKMGILDQSVAREMSKAGISFFKYGENAERIYKETLLAPRQLAEIQTTIQRMDEEIAESLLKPKKLSDAEIATIERKNTYKPTLESDAVSGDYLAGLRKGKPGLTIETPPYHEAHETTQRNVVMRDENGVPIAYMSFGVESEASGIIFPEKLETRPGYARDLVVYVKPEFRRQGIATKLYDYARTKGFDVSQVAGTTDLTPNGAAFVSNWKKNVHLKEAVIADLRDKLIERGELAKRIPGLQRLTDIVREGVADAHNFFPDYLGMHPVEQGLFRRLVPFWAWTKTISALAFKIPFISPKSMFLFHRFAATMQTLVGDPDLPEWMAGYFPTHVTQDGKTLWIRATSFSHFQSIARTKAGGIPIPSLFAFWESNPIINLGFRFAGGQVLFNPERLPFGEPVVNIGDGSVWTFRDDGKLERQIPQTPLISGLAHLFPTVQLIENLATPYQITGHNAVGLPQGVYNPDGTMKYPRELLLRIMGVLGPTSVKGTKEEFIRREKVQAYKAMKDLVKLYRRSGPDDQQYIREVFKDYGAGQYRKIKAR